MAIKMVTDLYCNVSFKIIVAVFVKCQRGEGENLDNRGTKPLIVSLLVFKGANSFQKGKCSLLPPLN